ncbi:MAG: DnaA/Hda family protein [Rickettsiales bacterium]|nr:DnaA/Hda family protein [Rickettsiales bacterium]
MSQYAFSLSLPADFSPANFVVSSCNHEAHQMLTQPWSWPALLLWGESGSGKSHLAHIWAHANQANIVQGQDFSFNPASISGPLAVDAIEQITDQAALFHLINYMKEQGYPLLLTARVPAATLPFDLADLTSRLRAMQAVSIATPDDAALAAVLRKQFADRQLKVANEVIEYLVARSERSFSAILDAVEKIDRQALAAKREITIPFIKPLFGY